MLRFHDHYWKEPVFGDGGMHPLAGIPADQLEADDDDDNEQLTGDENYGGVGGLDEEENRSVA